MEDKIVVPHGMIDAASKQPVFTEHEVYCNSCYGTGSESELFDGEIRRCTSCNGNKSVKEYRDKWGSHDFKPERKASDFEIYDILENSIEWLLGEVEKLELCQNDYANFRNIFLGRKTAVEYCPHCGKELKK